MCRGLFAVHWAPVSSTVLIASPEHLAVLKDREELGDAIVFPDSGARQALDLISRQRPRMVYLEQRFASTSRGTALINRIKADPALASCEVRVIAHDAPYSRSPSAHSDQPAGASAVAIAAPAPPAHLDQHGTRRAERFRILDGVEAQVDGNPTTLVNLSTVGAQLLSETPLKPNQRIRLSLPDPTRPIRISAVIAWAAFEIPASGPRYRAGADFLDADPDAILAFIELNKR
jgi:hypothetical protein